MSHSFLDTLRQKELPDWLYTWKAVFAIGIGGPFAIMLLGSMFATIGDGIAALLPADETAPACHLGREKPIKPGDKSFNFNDQRVYSLEPQRKVVVEMFFAAAEMCQPSRCLPEAKKTFRAAARSYIGSRASAQERLLDWYGDDGLMHANVVYGERDDERIVDMLRDRYRAGHFELDKLRSIEPATRMLLFRPVDKFTPCRQP